MDTDRGGEELSFHRLLTKARQAVFESADPISDEELKEIFAELQLDEAQLAMIRDYLDQLERKAPGQDRETGEEGNTARYREESKEAEECADALIRELIGQVLSGNSEAGGRLAEAFLPRVVQIARLYEGQGVPKGDLIGEGSMGLLNAIKMLRVSESAGEAEEFLAHMIMDAMEAAVAQQDGEGRINEKLLRSMEEIAEKAKELSGTLMRKVTVGELSKEMEFSAGQIREILRAGGAHIEEIGEQEETDE